MMLLRALKCDPVGVENGLLAVQEFEPRIQSVEEMHAMLKAGYKSDAAGMVGQKGSDYAVILIDGNMVRHEKGRLLLLRLHVLLTFAHSRLSSCFSFSHSRSSTASARRRLSERWDGHCRL
jgi:hypothetical protein